MSRSEGRLDPANVRIANTDESAYSNMGHAKERAGRAQGRQSFISIGPKRSKNDRSHQLDSFSSSYKNPTSYSYSFRSISPIKKEYHAPPAASIPVQQPSLRIPSPQKKAISMDISNLTTDTNVALIEVPTREERNLNELSSYNFNQTENSISNSNLSQTIVREENSSYSRTHGSFRSNVRNHIRELQKNTSYINRNNGNKYFESVDESNVASSSLNSEPFTKSDEITVNERSSHNLVPAHNSSGKTPIMRKAGMPLPLARTGIIRNIVN